MHDTGEFVEVNTHIKRDNAGIPHPVWECPYRLARMLKNSPSLKGKIKIWIASGKKQITDGEFIFNKSKKSKSIKSVN